jgi:RNase P subunit RPR2
MVRETSSASLFAQRPTLSFGPAQTHCPDCQAPLQVYQTQSKTLQTLHLGCFTAHQTLLRCAHCPNDRIYASEELSRLAPAGCIFG